MHPLGNATEVNAASQGGVNTNLEWTLSTYLTVVDVLCLVAITPSFNDLVVRLHLQYNISKCREPR